MDPSTSENVQKPRRNLRVLAFWFAKTSGNCGRRKRLLSLVASSQLEDVLGNDGFAHEGCYKASSDALGSLVIPSAESRDDTQSALPGNDFKARNNAVVKCAVAARLIGASVFGIYDGGECLADPSAQLSHTFTFSTPDPPLGRQGGRRCKPCGDRADESRSAD